MSDSKSNLTGKPCSICGKWHVFDEYSYGNRENNSYCKKCCKEVNAEYAVGGVEAARQYREDKRSARHPNTSNTEHSEEVCLSLRSQLVRVALRWQSIYGVAPSITTAISEYDAAMMVGMTEQEYSEYMQDKTAVTKGHDFIFKGIRYQIKAHRPSGKPGSFITNAGKAKNYDWDVLIWIRYNTQYEIQETWAWEREKYIQAFDTMKRISPVDMRNGKALISLNA